MNSMSKMQVDAVRDLVYDFFTWCDPTDNVVVVSPHYDERFVEIEIALQRLIVNGYKVTERIDKDGDKYLEVHLSPLGVTE